MALADYYEDPPARKACDEYYRISTLDLQKVRELAATLGVDVVMTTNVDHANVIMCTVAEELGLPHPYSLQTALLTTDKGLMKQRMQEAHVPTSTFATISGVDDLSRIDMAFPLVVKPVDNNGSKGVRMVEDADALERAAVDALGLSRKGMAVIEGFNVGREIQVDCYASSGTAHVLTIREKLKIPSKTGFAMQVYGSVVPPVLPSAVIDRCHQISQLIVDGFGLAHTPFFYQAVVNGEDVKVIELSPRIGGGLSYKLILDRTGIDVIDVAVESYFGDPKVRPIREDAAFLASTILYAKNGELHSVVGVEEALSEGVISSWDQMAQTGTRFADYMDSRNRVGAFYCSAPNHEELRKKVARANKVIDVLDPAGTSIKVGGLFFH